MKVSNMNEELEQLGEMISDYVSKNFKLLNIIVLIQADFTKVM